MLIDNTYIGLHYWINLQKSRKPIGSINNDANDFMNEWIKTKWEQNVLIPIRYTNQEFKNTANFIPKHCCSDLDRTDKSEWTFKNLRIPTELYNRFLLNDNISYRQLLIDSQRAPHQKDNYVKQHQQSVFESYMPNRATTRVLGLVLRCCDTCEDLQL